MVAFVVGVRHGRTIVEVERVVLVLLNELNCFVLNKVRRVVDLDLGDALASVPLMLVVSRRLVAEHHLVAILTQERRVVVMRVAHAIVPVMRVETLRPRVVMRLTIANTVLTNAGRCLADGLQLFRDRGNVVGQVRIAQMTNRQVAGMQACHDRDPRG
jgi:hypothetical protein